MSQYYVGVKQVFAWPEEKDGRAGYHVVYRYGQKDEYHSWSPKDEFERFYLPMGHAADESKINPGMVADFVEGQEVKSIGKTTVAHVTLANGFEVVEASSCVDPKNYDEVVGAGICMKRVEDRVWHLLGFVLQWARNGLGK